MSVAAVAGTAATRGLNVLPPMFIVPLLSSRPSPGCRRRSPAVMHDVESHRISREMQVITSEAHGCASRKCVSTHVVTWLHSREHTFDRS